MKLILLKTMMMAPKSDYALAKYLIDSSRVVSPVSFLCNHYLIFEAKISTLKQFVSSSTFIFCLVLGA